VEVGLRTIVAKVELARLGHNGVVATTLNCLVVSSVELDVEVTAGRVAADREPVDRERADRTPVDRELADREEAGTETGRDSVWARLSVVWDGFAAWHKAPNREAARSMISFAIFDILRGWILKSDFVL